MPAQSPNTLEKLRWALDQHAIVSISDGAGRILEVNDKFCSISGYSREELLGQNHRLLKSGRHPQSFYEEMWEIISQGRTWQGEICNRGKDGCEYWVRSTITPFMSSDGFPEKYISIRTDITHIKAVELVLEQNEIRYRSLVTAIADGIVLYDNNGRIVECNPAAEQILGLDRAQILGRNAGDIRWYCIHPNGSLFSAEEHPAMLTLATGTGYRDVVMGVYRPDGSLIWLSLSSEPVCIPEDNGNGKVSSVVVSFTDITKIRKAEVTARDSLNQLEATITAIPDLLFEMDSDGRYHDFRAPDQGMLAAPPDEIIGKTVDEVLNPEAAAIIRLALAEATSKGASYGRQIWLDVPNGNRCFELSVARKQLLGNSGQLRFILLSRDITERKQAEMALTEREQQLREAQKLAHLGNWQADLSTGELSWSDEIFNIFGHNPAVFTPTIQAFLAAVPPSDRPLIEASERKAAQTGLHDVTHRIIRPDGSIRHVRELARAECNESGQVVRLVGTVQDITDHIEAEARLHETEARFTFAVEGSGDGVWDWNIPTGEMPLSGHYETMLGYEKGEITPNIDTWIAMAHPDDLPVAKAALEAYLEGNSSSYAVELRLRCKDGSYKWVLCRGTVVERDEAGNPVRMIGIHSDISERKLAEKQLLVFRRLVETTNQSIRVSDDQDRIEFVNPAYQQLMGYSITEVLGQSFIKLGAAPGQELLIQEILAAMQEGIAWRGCLKLRRKDGSEFVSFSNFTPIMSPETGKLIHSFNMFVDYSEEIARQEALENAVKEANTANQAKSEFLSRMSHELRTPMNAIMGFASLMELEENLTEDCRDNLQEITLASRHLLGLINEVLDLAKVEAGHVELSIEPVNCTELLEECTNLLRPQAAKTAVSLQLEQLKVHSVRADRGRLKQVLLNLISNALKYNRPGGQVSIWGENLQTEFGHFLKLHIKDTGLGIAPERIKELFQPFNRLGAEYGAIEGTGIGLVITRNLMELMGGNIGVESTPNQGSDFWIQLPLEQLPPTPDTLPRMASSASGCEAKPWQRHTVLHIEDNPANLKLVSQALSHLPHIDLLTATTPSQGLKLVSHHAPDLILLDINLPEMDGYEVLAILKSLPETAHIPVVAVTANAMPQHIERGKNAGFTDYLTKPLDIALFLNVVERLLESQPHHELRESETGKAGC